MNVGSEVFVDESRNDCFYVLEGIEEISVMETALFCVIRNCSGCHSLSFTKVDRQQRGHRGSFPRPLLKLYSNKTMIELQ